MLSASVSVIIKDEIEMLPLTMPCYASLANCLKEVVFVDDNSTDGSREKALEIASHFTHLPIVWITHELTNWGEQRNLGLEACTGDFIMSVDADMGWTGNLRWLLEQDRFTEKDVWDFHLYICRNNQHEWDIESGTGVTSRFIRKGVRYTGNVHEQPDSINNGQAVTKAVCDDIKMFEWSSLCSPLVLIERGKRVQKFQKMMIARGIGPGDEERYIRFKYCNNPTGKFDQATIDMIPTMQSALAHWGNGR